MAETWSPTDKSTPGITLSAGNLTATSTDFNVGVRATAGFSTGKYYHEILMSNGGGGTAVACGLAPASAPLNNLGAGAVVASSNTIFLSGSSVGTLPGMVNGCIVGIAVDLGARLVWFRIAPSGNWNNSGTADPATGTGGVNISSLSGALYPIFQVAFGLSYAATANFGASAFSGTTPAGFTSGWGAAPTPVTGTLSATLGAVTLAGTGVIPDSGALAPAAFAPVTLAATGKVGTGGVLNQTLATLLLNPPASGAEHFGQLTRTLAALTLSVGAGTGLTAALDRTLAALALSGAGAVSKKGALTRTLAGLSLTATGALANRGVLGGTLGPARMLALGGLSSVAPGTPGVVSQQTFFFAWADEASEFDGSMLREDEQVFGFELTHEEGDFATLRLDLKNPRVGLLAAGRNVWCWFSWRDPASGLIEPLIHGRLIGIPENIQDEVVRLQFVARPSNYIAWKQIVAEGLKVRPFWDPVWISEGQDDPDTVLEARPASWHIDRVSLDVTASDTIIGEDGTLPITEDDHFYDGLKVSYGDTPLKSVSVTGTVTWTQQGSDIVDLTPRLWDQFRYAGSPYEYPMVSSFTGDGLYSDWPKPGSGIGGGWSMDATSGVAVAVWQTAWMKSIVYVSPVLSTAQEVITPGQYTYSGSGATGGYGIFWKPAVTRDREYVSAHETIATVFPLLPIASNFFVRWEASRPRTEIVRFTLAADTQDLLVDPGDDETDKLDLSSDFVGQGVDPGGALPIGDLRRNSYFNTDRGSASVEYLIMLARAKILSRARAVNLSVETPFAFATGLSCRMNATVFDPRLPGGEATGKVTKYALTMNGDSGEAKAEVTIGCTVGRGNSVTPDPGEPTYSDDYNTGYEAMDGATFDAGTGDILYESFDGIAVVDDDDLDLFRMTPDRVVKSLTVTNGPDFQQNTLDSFYRNYTPPGIEQKPPEMGVPVGTYVAPETPTEMLSKMPTTVTLDLVPISKQSFQTEWDPAVSALMVPKTIDLEAPYV